MSPNRTVRLTPRQAVWALITLTVAITVCTIVVATLVSATKSTKISEKQDTNTTTLNNTNKTLKNTTQTLDLLLDCTQPKGECYQRGQANTQGAVEDITKYAVFAAVCVDEPGRQTVKQTTACILELVEADEVAKKESGND